MQCNFRVTSRIYSLKIYRHYWNTNPTTYKPSRSVHTPNHSRRMERESSSCYPAMHFIGSCLDLWSIQCYCKCYLWTLMNDCLPACRSNPQHHHCTAAVGQVPNSGRLKHAALTRFAFGDANKLSVCWSPRSSVFAKVKATSYVTSWLLFEYHTFESFNPAAPTTPPCKWLTQEGLGQKFCSNSIVRRYK